MDDTAYDWLRRHAAGWPGSVALVRWTHEPADRRRFSFAELDTVVAELVNGLRIAGVRPGDRVLLSLPNDESFVSTLVGCIGAAAVAVPGPVPAVSRSDAFVERIQGILKDCDPAVIVTRTDWVERLRAVAGEHWRVVAWEQLRHAGAAGPGRQVAPGDVAFLQYTSGSTRHPRGVVVTHRMLRASCEQAAVAYREDRTDVAVTWVPLYHDMGLITGVTRPLYSGYRSVLLRPEEFASDPRSWLSALTHEQGTLSSAPNFAYDLCVRKVDRTSGLDLSAWRVARNAGEVVRADTMDAFVRTFGPAGFSAAAFCPSYGMAEATLTISTCGPDVPSLRLAIPRRDLDGGMITWPGPADVQATDHVVLRSSGVAVSGSEVRISGTRQDGEVGEIMVRGPQVFDSYWGSPAEPGAADGWLATGDRGFLAGGHVFVLGRTGDVVVVRGRNFYVGADVLPVCAQITGLRPGRAALFVTRSQPGHDDAHLVVEVRPEAVTSHALSQLRRRVQRTLARALDLYVTAVHLVPAGGLPVTTSGKVRAAEVRRRFEAGELDLLP